MDGEGLRQVMGGEVAGFGDLQCPGPNRPLPPLPCPTALLWADDERMLVEPACGAALAAIYSGLLGRLQAEGRLPRPLPSVVVIVCGGNSIDSQELRALNVQLGQG